jgi:5-methyltetrahydropteroyltriglutamate--homocysteine methyltransferase
LFSIEAFDGFFLEFDDERSGSFEPLKFIKNQRIVLGLVTSKTPELENKDLIIKRIKEASQYVPLEQICLSPQCGFASTHEGNKLTEKDQWEKLKLVVEISKEVWPED